MKIAALVVGVIAVLLGSLWLLQGIGLRIDPILCFAECEPLEGPSPLWAVIGFVVLAAGLAALVYSLRRRTPR